MELQDYLNHFGLSNQKEFNRVFSLSKSKLSELISGILSCEDIYSSQEKTKNLFRFAANKQLSAGLFPCVGFKCRMKEAYNLAIFSVLYADQVIIYFPFEKYKFEKRWSENARTFLFTDLIIYNFIKPLILKGYIKCGNGDLEFCTKCLKEALSPFSIEIKQIEKRVLSNSTIIFNKDHETFKIKTEEEDLFGHKENYFGLESKILKKQCENFSDRHQLSIEEIKKSKLIVKHIADYFLDIVLQNQNANMYNASYLTNNEFSVNMISLLNEKSFAKNEKTKYDNLTHQLPYIYGTNIKNLIELREKDFESFILYRDTIKKAIGEACDNREKMNEIYEDLIRPNLNRLNLTINNSRKLLNNNIKQNIILGSSLLSIGLFSGIIPSSITAVLGTIGGCEILKTIYKNFCESPSTNKEIINDNFYFLWKAQKVIN